MIDRDMYDFDGEFAQTYTEKCPACGTETEVSTQRDGNPEYYTGVYVRCTCGDSVAFNLPVN
jgi:cytochrome c1